ncbi:MAG: hemolysin family protein [Oscillospiraceae bacterium]|nr:hemolysin family protein [Oscillospiraceae bacterium]
MDDPGSTPLAALQANLPLSWTIILLIALIGVNAFFSMSELAIISLNDTKVERLADEGDKRARRVRRLLSSSSGFLSTIQIGVTLAGFLTSAIASDKFVGMFSARLTSLKLLDFIPDSVVVAAALIIVTLITSYFTLVLGELVPKKIAMQYPEKISYRVAGILLFFKKMTTPFVKILSLSTNGIVRLFGMDPDAELESVTEEEILMMVDVGEEKGVIEDVQKEMINNIFEFDDISAGDIMTHRTDMVAIDAEDPLEDVVKLSIEEGRSRIPVYEDDPDNIVGIIYIKDLLPYIGQKIPKENTLKNFMRKAYFVPESKRCGDLFKEMTESHIQIAIVVDEYGGTAGLVTIEDLLESIVGNMQDEYDDEEDEISQINDTTFTVDGTTFIDELDDLVGVTLPEGDFETIGGFVISRLGFLPQDGDMNVVEYENLSFTVMNVEDRRIGKIKVEILPRGEDSEKEKSKKDKV